jgi:dihydroflavonol-4-reductase
VGYSHCMNDTRQGDMIMKRTAFVTGSTGFLGLNLIGELSNRGWDITALHVPSADLHYLSQYDVKKVCGDILDYDFLKNAVPSNVDSIFHLAANTSAWSKNNRQQYLDNVVGTQNMVNIAIEKKAKRFVHTSSISAYGYYPETTIVESTMSNALTCKMNYNKTKFQAELVVKEAVKKGLSAVILNPCNVIGPYDTNNWTRQLIKPIYNGKLSLVPPGKAMWCHVSDIVDAHINAVDRGGIGENYLLGGTEGRFLDVVNEIERLMGKKESGSVQHKWVLKIILFVLFIKSKIDGKEPLLTKEKYNRAVGYIRCNYDKAVKTFDYKTTSLEIMIKDTVQWLKKEHLL